MSLTYTLSVNESYRKNKNEFWNLSLQNNLMVVKRKYSYLKMILLLAGWHDS